MEVLPFDQYVVKVSGSNCLNRRNRKFLQDYKPAITQKEIIVPVSQDVEPEFELESAWGAKGHVTSSADPNTSLGDGQTIAAPGSQDIPSPVVMGDSHGTEMDSSLGGRGIDTGQLDMSCQEQSVGLRRSVRANKGKTSQFKDCITGSELESIGDHT